MEHKQRKEGADWRDETQDDAVSHRQSQAIHSQAKKDGTNTPPQPEEQHLDQHRCRGLQKDTQQMRHGRECREPGNDEKAGNGIDQPTVFPAPFRHPFHGCDKAPIQQTSGQHSCDAPTNVHVKLVSLKLPGMVTPDPVSPLRRAADRVQRRAFQPVTAFPARPGMPRENAWQTRRFAHLITSPGTLRSEHPGAVG